MTTSYGAYFYQEIDPASTFGGPEDPDVALDFTCNHLALEADGGDIEVSYNGITVHAKIYDDGLGPKHFPDIHVGKIWLRSSAGILRVTAW